MMWLSQDHLAAKSIIGTKIRSVHFSAAFTEYSLYLMHCARHKVTSINSVYPVVTSNPSISFPSLLCSEQSRENNTIAQQTLMLWTTLHSHGWDELYHFFPETVPLARPCWTDPGSHGCLGEKTLRVWFSYIQIQAAVLPLSVWY